MKRICFRRFLGHVKSFEDIPEPSILDALKKSYERFNNVKFIHKSWLKAHQEYGSIFKEKFFPGGEYTVFCSSPQDTEIVFRSDGRMPVRDNLINMVHVRRKLNEPLGLMNENGNNWYRMRTEVNKYMLNNKHVWGCVHQQAQVTKDLIKYMKTNMNCYNEVPNFGLLLHKWAFEMTGVFLLNARLGSFGCYTENKPKEMVECTLNMFNLVGETLFSAPVLNASKMKKLIEAQKQQLLLAEHFARLGGGKENKDTLLSFIKECPNIYKREKLMLISDLLLAGIDTTANAAAFILYCLAKNPQCQEKIREEIFAVNIQGNKVIGKDLERMHYVTACIKEAHRMYPFVTSFSRRNNKDLVLSGYHIPKGTNILNISNCINNYNEEFFPEPYEFIPERWIRQHSFYKRNSFVLTGSFGMGTRKCLGRKYATQEIKLLLVEILTNFEIHYNHKPIELIFNLVSYPSEPPQFKFTPL